MSAAGPCGHSAGTPLLKGCGPCPATGDRASRLGKVRAGGCRPPYPEGVLASLDPRLKLAACTAAIALALATPVPRPNDLLLGGATLGAISVMGVSRVALRLLPLAWAGALAALSQAFLVGVTPAFGFSLGPWEVLGYAEGLRRAHLLYSRVMAAGAAAMLLSATTPVWEMGGALRWFHAPASLVEMLTFAYRYVWVLGGEALAVKRAQAVRLGYSSWRRGLASGGVLGGVVLLRALDRAERVHRAMASRCFSGSLPAGSWRPPGVRDVVAAGVVVILLGAAAVLAII